MDKFNREEALAYISECIEKMNEEQLHMFIQTFSGTFSQEKE